MLNMSNIMNKQSGIFIKNLLVLLVIPFILLFIIKYVSYNSINSNNEYLLTNTTNLFIDNIKKKPNIDRDKIIKIIYKN